jgi:probable rRNA maturation factor
MIKITESIHPINRDFLTPRLTQLDRLLELKGDITVKLGSEQESRSLNREYRKKDYSTDVLSFPIQQAFPDGYYLGDIFICYPLAKRQAQQFNVSFQSELLRLIVHGVLHLTGYDHERDSGEMEQLQEELLKKLHTQES